MTNFRKDMYLYTFGILLFAKCTPNVCQNMNPTDVIATEDVISSNSENIDKTNLVSDIGISHGNFVNNNVDNECVASDFESVSLGDKTKTITLESNNKYLIDYFGNEKIEENEEENKEETLYDKMSPNDTINVICENAIKSPIEYKVYERSVYANKNKLLSCKEHMLLERKITVTRYKKNCNELNEEGYCKKGGGGRIRIGKYIVTEDCSYDYERGKEVINEKVIVIVLRDSELEKYKDNSEQKIGEKQYICNKISLDFIIYNLKKELNYYEENHNFKDSSIESNCKDISEKSDKIYSIEKYKTKPNPKIFKKYPEKKPLRRISEVKERNSKRSIVAPSYYNIMSGREVLISLVWLQFGFIFSAWYFGNFK